MHNTNKKDAYTSELYTCSVYTQEMNAGRVTIYRQKNVAKECHPEAMYAYRVTLLKATSAENQNRVWILYIS